MIRVSLKRQDTLKERLTDMSDALYASLLGKNKQLRDKIAALSNILSKD